MYIYATIYICKPRIHSSLSSISLRTRENSVIGLVKTAGSAFRLWSIVQGRNIPPLPRVPESLCLGNGILELVSRTRPLATPREVFTEEEEEGSLLFRAAFVSSRIINVPLGRLLLLS